MKSRTKKIKKIKSSSSMPNILSKTKNNIKDFGLFTKYIDKQLLNYNLDSKDLGETHSILNRTGMKLGRNEKQILDLINTKNPMYNLKNDTKNFNSTFMMVSIKNNFYENPLHSLKVLKKNNSIAHDIVNKNIFRQKSIFDDTIEKIKLNKKFFKKKCLL